MSSAWFEYWSAKLLAVGVSDEGLLFKSQVHVLIFIMKNESLLYLYFYLYLRNFIYL